MARVGRLLGLTVVVVVAVSGCSQPRPERSSNAAPATSVTSVTAPASATVLPLLSSTGSVLSVGVASTGPGPTSASSPSTPDPTGPVGSGVVVRVDGGPLPVEVVTAIRSGGGELVATSAWTGRYGDAGFPTIDGPDVVLVEATLDADRSGGGWRRRDGRQWLFADTGHGGRDALLDRVAAAAGITDWPVTVDGTVVDNAPCSTRTYRSTSVTWGVHGCSYPRYPGLFAVGITRDATVTGEPPVVEPSALLVAAVVGGRVETVSVRLGHPDAVGSTSTLRTTVTVSWPARPDAVDRVLVGPLAGWQRFGGDDSVMVAGLAGRWVLTGSGATFASDGRFGR